MTSIPRELQKYFSALAVLGAIVLAGDTWLSFKFGATIGWEMALIFAAISIASGLLLVAAVLYERQGVRPLAIGLASGWLVAFAMNIWSNMGVATANRMVDVQQARVQQTTYAGGQAKIAEQEASLKLFTEQLQRLLAENAWAATVTAEGLRQQATTLEAAIREEGDPRNGGCKRKCLDLMAQKATVDKQIAVAEQRADLTGRIEATKRTLVKLRDELAATKAGISHTANQSALYAKLVAWNLAQDPDAASVTVANEATGIATALVLAILSTVLTLAGAWPHLQAARPLPQAALGREPHPVQGPAPVAATSPAPLVPLVQPREIVIRDTELARRLAALRAHVEARPA